MVYDHRHTNSCFVRVENVPAGFLAGDLQQPVHRQGTADELRHARRRRGICCSATAAEAGLVDPAKFDFHLKAGSPCIGRGVAAGKAGDFDLTPTLQYVHPCKSEPRPAGSRLDVGAYQFAPRRP